MTTDLERIEAYYDTVPRANSRVEQLGPFTLFIGTADQPFYARPAGDRGGAPTVSDIDEVRRRQRRLGQPEAIEWIGELHPGLDVVVASAGLQVQHLQLMVHRTNVSTALPAGYTARMVPADDPLLLDVIAAIGVGFHFPGTAVGSAGSAERIAIREAAIANDNKADLTVRDAIRAGRTAIATVGDSTGPVAGGSHSPRGSVTEITGVATLPAHRRRGLGAVLAAVLGADAQRRGVDLCFLSSASDDVARVYAGAGFVRVATACVAGLPA